MGIIQYPHGPKATWEDQAIAISSGQIEMSETDIPMLLKWLQDMNWPGSNIIARYLVRFGNSLINPIADVLQSKDAIWINWVLLAFVDKFDFSFWNSLKDNLKSVASMPDEEGAHIVAITLLAKWNLTPKDQLKDCLADLKTRSNLSFDDYEELEEILTM